MTVPPFTLGVVLAVVTFILAILLTVLGKIPAMEGLLFGLLALCRVT